MKIDLMLLHHDLATIGAYAQAAEALGFDGLWTSETTHDPFLPLVLAAEQSRRITLGTAIAVTLPRAPGVLAQIGWDLANYSQGRFILGLGSQVRAHNERRFGARWDKPVRQMRETIEAVRAIWHSYQSGEPLRYEGEYFSLKLMTPFFNPGPIAQPHVPIYISAVNEQMLRLAGSHCEGVHLHPIHTVRYLDEYAWPHLTAGMAKGGRCRGDFQAAAGIFVIPTDALDPAAAEAHVRQQIGFYLSTPAYRVITELHGWTDQAFQLSKLARRSEWDAMPRLISDEILDTFAISGAWTELPAKVQQKYGGRLDRVSYYLPFAPGVDEEGWQLTVAGFQGIKMD
ncbi:MAG: TIGR03617 family F420-dependent LLM class oxidoreductase [Caldilineaceae bacterium]